MLSLTLRSIKPSSQSCNGVKNLIILLRGQMRCLRKARCSTRQQKRYSLFLLDLGGMLTFMVIAKLVLCYYVTAAIRFEVLQAFETGDYNIKISFM